MELILGVSTETTDIPVTFPDFGSEATGMDPFKIPYTTELCLDLVFQRVEAFAKSENTGVRFMAQEVLRRAAKRPELRQEIHDPMVLHDPKNKEILDLLLLFLVSPIDRDRALFKFNKPFTFNPVYISPAMERLMSLENACYSFGNKLPEVVNRHQIMVGCTILQRIYGVEVDMEPSAILTVPDPTTGLHRFYRPTMDDSFIEVVPVGKPPELSQQQIQRLLNNIKDTDLWQKLLPPDKFKFRGFQIAHLTEVTKEEALSRLKHRLISRDAILDIERVKDLANLIRIHFQNESLELGLAAVDYPTERAINHEYRIRFNLLSESIGQLTNEAYRGSIYDRAFRSREVLIVEDLQSFSKPTKLEKELLKLGIRSILLAPLLDQDKNVIGIVELGCPEPFAINAFMEVQFQEIRGLFRTAVERSREYIDNRIEAIMRDQYTSLHPSIEWRFTQAAFNILQRQEAGEENQPEEISFKGVYPLYAQADIVGSSKLRNAAIYQDLVDNMRSGRFFLARAMELVEFPLTQQVIMRIDALLVTTVEEFDNSHEILFADLIQRHLTPLIQQLGDHHPDLRELAEQYFSDLDPDLGLFYRVRRDYEQSVSRLNRALSDFFSARDQAAQATLPHYYEKYKTDGVEYEIYAGQSLLKNQQFSDVHLRNLRLSQLIDLCEATRLVNRVSAELPMPLRTAQLVFAYTNQLDIKFRMDEKRFDVDGDYNVRYEILKKRIDKATIRKGTQRLTLADQISIVYLQDRDKTEYLGYLNFLQQAGYIDGEIEDLVLDPLQSVNGLRALRFKVKS